MISMLFVTEMPTEAREKMFFAGLDLFTTKGFKETSILEIVESARVSKSTFYQFFSGKEDLLTSLCQRLADEIYNEVKAAVDSEETVNSKALKGIRRYIEICFSEKETARLLLIVSAGVSPDMEKIRLEVYERFAAMVFHAVQLPETVTERQIKSASLAMVGAINQVVIHSLVDNGEQDIDELAELLTRIVMSGFISLAY
ncbi:TetR/AcrR family transcriptional regulator [Mesobacillus harenae]|uniref:TetR/AcrR family transcriptional regulator n=1 Tax=Mesobacillus harenae TaxID=2213203 RepID=UPI001580C4D6|nr:TetR/AcrR family transcriptional regulator [Mesobacillus harenae]